MKNNLNNSRLFLSLLYLVHALTTRKCRDVTVLLVLTLCGCAAFEPATTLEPVPLVNCRALFKEIGLAVEHSGVRDQGPVSIKGFPFLRANRFLASFVDELVTEEQFQAWVEHLALLDADARALERRNLWQGSSSDAPATSSQIELDNCSDLMVRSVLADPQQRSRLRAAVKVPDDYVTGWRVAGLYPLTSLFVARRIQRAQDETRQVFSQPLETLPVSGYLQRWQSAAVSAPSEFDPAPDPLGIPVLTDTQVGALFRRHAPVWEVDVVDANDLIGTAVWRKEPAVDTAIPTQYQKLSYTRFGSHVLLQLNYVIWFSARPGDNMYSGHLDGLTWRVTLGPDGEPWLYDNIHNCGCYHIFMPTHHLKLRGDLPKLGFEPPLVPQSAPTPPLVLRVASGTHYLERVYTDGEAGVGGSRKRQTVPAETLVAINYDNLRSLPAGEGYRSFFGEFGLVEGSERGERFILWPMGVRSPGAMRSWGHHPVAFVGRRHFDDARLLESLFVGTDP